MPEPSKFCDACTSRLTVTITSTSAENGGSFEIGVDHRILLGSDYHSGNYCMETVYTVMPK